ncbi:hypothetical protein CHGG_06152 [Chaetomium globosum CBS 148.51]|uniref:Uncharacterized protein n=1 Tax=Chaetomium globosum (strain ATCC 6205 / CBS 148.51 / DSM 1962 / NBRC 6347 / NRRL 1970) TaxID=306901 RepID=Q2H5B3_CHAGB|nr:uncharacterized protein CHGG_06152 [Chaetomium globosum CBS 148.51]EAQ89533.1 hypothetical protein CHGG_06152 [Chaetomium globosum CBS 148.51]
MSYKYKARAINDASHCCLTSYFWRAIFFMTIDVKFTITLGASLLACYLYPIWKSGRMSTTGSNAAATSSAGGGRYDPSIVDVIVAKAMLTKALTLPPEIIDKIVDLAEYWPHTTTELNGTTVIARGNNTTLGSSRTGAEDMFLPPGEEYSADDFQQLIASPISLLAQPCRRIVFTIRSRDQGWGGSRDDHGTYHGSWSWFEAGLERWCKTSPAQTSSPEQPDQTEQRLQEPSLKLDDLCTVIPEVEWEGEVQNAYIFKHELHPSDQLKVQCNLTAEKESPGAPRGLELHG